jgi:hypothetical protein
MPRKYELTEEEAAMAFRQVASHCETLKNWIVSAVEHNDDDRARQMAADLRNYQRLFAKLNVDAHRVIDSSETIG